MDYNHYDAMQAHDNLQDHCQFHCQESPQYQSRDQLQRHQQNDAAPIFQRSDPSYDTRKMTPQTNLNHYEANYLQHPLYPGMEQPS